MGYSRYIGGYNIYTREKAFEYTDGDPPLSLSKMYIKQFKKLYYAY